MNPFIETLRLIPIFNRLNENQLNHVALKLTSLTLAQDETLFRFGEPGDAMYIVQEGQMEIFVTADSGEKVILNIFLAGNSFGEMALLDGRSRSANAAAGAPTKLLRLARKDFLDIITRWPEWAQEIIADVAGKLRFASENIQDLAFALEQANQQLHTLDELKSAFIRLITPETILKLTQGDTETGATLQALARVFNAYPDWTTTGQDIAPFINQSLQTHHGLIQEKRLQLHTMLDSGLVAYVHPEAIHTAISNLIGYAARMTNPESHFLVQCWVDNDRLHFAVWDTSSAIPNDSLITLWDKFAHMADPLTHDPAELDLDLTLVKVIITAHGGQVQAQSKRNQGITLGFHIPVMPEMG